MKRRLPELKSDAVRIPLFILLCYIIRAIFLLFADAYSAPLSVAIMAAPTFMALLTRKLTGEKGTGEFFMGFRGKPRYYIAGYYLPIAALALGALVYYLLFPAHFDPDMGLLASRDTGPSPEYAKWSFQYGIFFFPIFLEIGLNYLGEAFGWFGYLLPKLIKRFKVLPAAMILCIAWSMPEFITTAFFQGDALFQDMGGLLRLVDGPGIGNSFLPLLLTIMLLYLPISIFATRLAIKTRSFIPAVLAHATYMLYSSLWGYFLAVGVEDHPLSFFITWGPMIALCVFSMLQMMKEEREGRLLPPEPEPVIPFQDASLVNRPL